MLSFGYEKKIFTTMDGREIFFARGGARAFYVDDHDKERIKKIYKFYRGILFTILFVAIPAIPIFGGNLIDYVYFNILYVLSYVGFRYRIKALSSSLQAVDDKGLKIIYKNNFYKNSSYEVATVAGVLSFVFFVIMPIVNIGAFDFKNIVNIFGFCGILLFGLLCTAGSFRILINKRKLERLS